MKLTITLVSIAFVLGACQWVKTSDAGMNVSLVKAEHVQNCKNLGTTRVSVKDKIGFIKRKKGKVADELINLARNEAARSGGDSIVAEGPETDGEQSFSIYNCHGQ